ncbi:hypothetical protein FFWV33_05895 [Flavobacterium faecale]|uniref:Uncharacterized protein n=1 Tax=Flavobacterium faecale TaxID=1355330 RepID=A0A2S1LBL6_9FLAO|nr:hypothetical protein [Flavobacterium faecale]AWG21098.1 hypothetical protein FFWV33_05895 [Flavobacterium faecale]
MKKRLEADLISIAHRILQLKNKSDVNQLFLETQKLYEKLSVLRFVEEQYGAVKPTIGHAEMVSDVASFYDNEAPILQTLTQDNVIDEVAPETVATEEPIAEVIEVETAIAIEEVPAIEKTEEVVEEIAIIESEEAPEIVATEEATIEEAAIEEEEETEDEDEEDIQLDQIPDEVVFEEVDEEIIEEDEDEEEEVEEEELEELEEETEEEETVVPPAFTPNFMLSTEDEEEKVVEIEEKAIPVAVVDVPKKAEAVQISFEDLLGGHYSEPQFVKVDNVPAAPPIPVFEPVKSVPEPVAKVEEIVERKEEIAEKASPKVVSLNDKFSKGIDIDLNDQIAFVKHLFGNSREDYNRVMSQLITFDNFYETKDFIDHMVKPDYNEWKGKDDYAERFMDIIEKKFL